MIDVDKNKLLARCARRQAMAMSQQQQQCVTASAAGRCGCAAMLSQSHVGIGPVSFLATSIDATKNHFQKRNRAYSENFRRVTVTLFWVPG
jgi:hypothetical protein